MLSSNQPISATPGLELPSSCGKTLAFLASVVSPRRQADVGAAGLTAQTMAHSLSGGPAGRSSAIDLSWIEALLSRYRLPPYAPAELYFTLALLRRAAAELPVSRLSTRLLRERIVTFRSVAVPVERIVYRDRLKEVRVLKEVRLWPPS